jgi:hypothetical protein
MRLHSLPLGIGNMLLVVLGYNPQTPGVGNVRPVRLAVAAAPRKLPKTRSKGTEHVSDLGAQ